MVAYTLLRTPAVQTILTREIAAYLSKELNTDIKIGGVNIVWVKDLALENLEVKDRYNKSILSAKELRLDLRKLSRTKRQIHINRIQFDEAEVNLIKQKQDSLFNYQFLINYFNGDQRDSIDKAKWYFRINSIKLNNSKFAYQNQLKDTISKGISYNNIQLDSLNLYARNLLLENDTISADIKDISCIERSGFKLKSFKTRAKVSSTGVLASNLQVQTDHSLGIVNLKLHYDEYKDYLDFINKVRIDAQIKPSDIFMEDIAFFAPAMFGMKNKLRLSGVVDGTVKNITVNDLIFSFGASSKFYGDITMKGLPDIKNTFTNLTIYELSSTQSDLKDFKLPKGKTIMFPEKLEKIGTIQLQGSFEGLYTNFLSDASCYTDIGQLSTYMALKKNLDTEIIEYKGTVKALDFELGTMLNMPEYFGKMNLTTEINGQGISFETIKANLNGTIDSLDFVGNLYNSIVIKGDLFREQFRGLLEVNDEFINLDFYGLVDFKQKPYRFDFTSNINDAKLGLLNLSNRDIEANLSTQIQTRLFGSHIDELTGNLNINNTVYSEHEKEYRLDQIKLSIETNNDSISSVVLESDIVDASMYGVIKPSELIPNITNYFFKHLPALGINHDTTYLKQDILLRGTIKKLSPVTKLFAPDLRVARNTRFEGSFNSQNASVDFNISGRYLDYKNLRFKDWHTNLTGESNKINILTGCDSIFIKNIYKNDSLLMGLEDFDVYGSIDRDTVNFSVHWDLLNSPGKNMSLIGGKIDLNQYPKVNFQLDTSNIYHRDSLWNISQNNMIKVDSNNFSFHDFRVWGAGQAFLIDGSISDNPSDSLTLQFKNLNISSLDMLSGNESVDLNANLSGSIAIVDLYNHPNFISDLQLNQLYFNDVKFGDAYINTSWDEMLRSLNIQSKVIYTGNVGQREILDIQGWYYPMQKDNNIHLEANANKIDIRILQPFFDNLVSDLNGKGTGKLYLDGSFSKPLLTGSVNLMRSGARVDYLNTYYTFTNPVKFEKDFIWFDNMTVNDSLGNTAICNGKIYHQHFKDFEFDISITPENFSSLNTSMAQNDMFYGQAFASGLVTIKGPMEEIIMDANVNSEKDTEVFIPVSYAADVSENDFITFIEKKDTTQMEEDDYELETSSSSFGINMQIGVNQLADVEIILPYQMGRINGNGDGDMQLNMSPEGEFTMLGDYNISKGSFLFKIPNILSRNFKIQDGGTISWSGDPFDAVLDIKAVYPVRASLDAILSESPGAETDISSTSRRVDVNCIIALKNNLLNPDIRFMFDLPNADPEIKDQLFQAFDTTNIAEVNMQFVSLLVQSSFVSANSGLNTPNVGNTSMEMLSNQISGWISAISDDFDVALNYRQGDDISSDELEVALSTQLFNDRVTIDGNFGVQQGTQANQNTSNIIGDVNIEYRVTPDGQFRLRVFNRTNDIDLIDYEAPYTQGVGIFYRKEFDHFSDLFKRKKKKEISQKPDSTPLLPSAISGDSTLRDSIGY